MKKPVTAAQLAMIIWIPVVAIAIAWFAIAGVREARDVREADKMRQLQQDQATRDTDLAAKRLEDHLNEINQQEEAVRGASR